MATRRGSVISMVVLGLAIAGCARESEKSSAPPETPSVPGAPSAGEPNRLLSPPKTALAPSGPTRRSFTTIRVFYGTNRKPSGETAPGKFYGSDAGPLTFGFCDVSIPPDHEPGELESPKLWKFEIRENPEKHVVLLGVHPASGPEFITELQRAVWDSIEWKDRTTILGGEALVFVHGFNNSFEEAARRTAQIVKDLRFRGAPVMFSWPSGEQASVRGYQEDARRISGSEEEFLSFLAGVARESGARRIHVIAHSMGNRLVTETLRRVSYHIHSGQLPKFNQVVLTAPDIDANYFRTAIAPRIVQTADRITIYSSSRDLALKASSFVNQLGKQRLGEAGKELNVFPEYRNIEVVDASTVDTGLFSLRHSYHADDVSVLADIEQVLVGLAPGERGLQSLLDAMAWRIRGSRQAIRQATHTVVR